ncbi:MAG: C40 family peptidase [Proteobacteria bacterium]|nr:C40 family peptidase [Pseudomonadota bacterium]
MSQPTCPARQTATYPLSGMSPEIMRADYWISLLGEEADTSLLSKEQIDTHNKAMRQHLKLAKAITNLEHSPTPEDVIIMLKRRLGFVSAHLKSGEYRTDDAKALSVTEVSPQQFRPGRDLRVAVDTVPLRCAPFTAPILAPKRDPRFDRNSCSIARSQEPIEILGRIGTGLRLARTSYAVGFISDDAALSPAVEEQWQQHYRKGPRVQVTKPIQLQQSGNTITLPVGTLLPVDDDQRAVVATAQGFFAQRLPAQSSFSTNRPLTRRALIKQAFLYLDTPYGWGGQNSGLDCSRLIMDIARSFGLELPRISNAQGRAGLYTVNILPEAMERERMSILDAAHARGIVLVHFPGHIMLYLGRDKTGTPRVLHSFAEYLVPCGDALGETLVEVDRVTISDLSLGKGSSRGSFLERITKLAVLGRAPGYELASFSQFRPSLSFEGDIPQKCDDSLEIALWRSPRRPVSGESMRLIVTTVDDMRPARLFAIDSDGTVYAPPTQHLGAGPFAQVVVIDDAKPGLWTVVLADGSQVLACERFGVLRGFQAKKEDLPEEIVAWDARLRWETDTENFYATFVEQLFSHPLEDMRTWKSLSELLRDPKRNLLYNYLGLGEERLLTFEPDCADLPYFLRGYFAFKLRLPFGYRFCSRPKPGRPLWCGDLHTNQTPIPIFNPDLTDAARAKKIPPPRAIGRDEIDLENPNHLELIDYFLNRLVRNAVHAANPVTHPDNQDTDLYPIALTRTAIRPGTVFVDPYGHVIVIAKWIPQGFGDSGILVGADAQPDATVGRRRFWRGSFLFSPDTSSVGSGFKAFRPLLEETDKEKGDTIIVPLPAEMLASQNLFPRLSKEQYELSVDEFYWQIENLISPRPLDPMQRALQLIDALEEQVNRRATSVNNGVEYIAGRETPIPMPKGHDIFETKGPWEDYATPSRDMRLLIAIDTARRLVSHVQKHPERFGIALKDADTAAEQTENILNRELRKRRLSYRRSNNETFELSLADVVARAEAFEMAYNPNDCVEVRWGAPAGSDEIVTCQKRAPADQIERMLSYRGWFKKRTRPQRR